MNARPNESSSPCIGYCSTSLGDAVCLGCGRSAEEIDRWILLDEAERHAIWARVNGMDTIRNRRGTEARQDEDPTGRALDGE